MNNNQSDASQCIQDGVANMNPDIRKRIDDSLKISIPPNHTLSDDGLGSIGIVHNIENVISEKERSIDRFVIHKMMDAISLQCGRSQEDRQAMLRLLSRVLEIAEHENISDVDIIDHIRHQFEDLS